MRIDKSDMQMRVRDFMLTHQITIPELAQTAGVSRSSVYGWLSGAHVPTDRSLRRLQRLGFELRVVE
jgi:predicted DNA-binding transcriptional regulator AlpA